MGSRKSFGRLADGIYGISIGNTNQGETMDQAVIDLAGKFLALFQSSDRYTTQCALRMAEEMRYLKDVRDEESAKSAAGDKVSEPQHSDA